MPYIENGAASASVAMVILSRIGAAAFFVLATRSARADIVAANLGGAPGGRFWCDLSARTQPHTIFTTKCRTLVMHALFSMPPEFFGILHHALQIGRASWREKVCQYV